MIETIVVVFVAILLFGGMVKDEIEYQRERIKARRNGEEY